MVVAGLVASMQAAFGQPEVPRDQLFLDQSPAQTEALRKKFPACRTETYTFASRVYCFGIDPKALERTIANDDPSAVSDIQLLPREVRRPDIFARKSFSRKVGRDRTTGGVEWLGSVHSDQKPEVKIGTALFSFRAGTLAGRITTGKEVYEIRPLQKGIHVIIQADLKKMPPTHPKKNGSSSPIPQAPSTPVSAQCTAGIPVDDPNAPEITVSVILEDGVMPATTDLESMAQSYVASTDIAMGHSAVAARISPAGASYVHTIPPFITGFSTVQAITWGSSTSLSTPIRQIHQWRAADNADVVVIVTAGLGRGCGFTPQPPQPKSGDPKYGFVFVFQDCALVTMGVAHEIGHVMGGDHEVSNLVGHSPVSELYARAYIDAVTGRQTIMTQVVAQTNLYEPLYSNPAVCWDTQPPQPTGVTDVADNARAIGERAPLVSQFMP